MTNKKGTGDKLGEIKFDDGFKWVIKDDGDPDNYITIEFYYKGKRTTSKTVLPKARTQLGDEKFMEKLDEVDNGNEFHPLI